MIAARRPAGAADLHVRVAAVHGQIAAVVFRRDGVIESVVILLAKLRAAAGIFQASGENSASTFAIFSWAAWVA
jgi:hypothetical protein